MSSARWVVGKGDKIDLRNDRWLANGEMIALSDNSDLRWVEELIDPNFQSWDLAKFRQNFLPRDVLKILQTPIAWNFGEDTIWWPFPKLGEFSVKFGYHQTKMQAQKVRLAPSSSTTIDPHLWKNIWAVKIPPKIKYFLWKVCHNILLVGENLCKKRIKNSTTCPLCEKEVEIVEHLLFFCEWTRVVWFGVQVQCVPDRYNIY